MGIDLSQSRAYPSTQEFGYGGDAQFLIAAAYLKACPACKKPLITLTIDKASLLPLLLCSPTAKGGNKKSKKENKSRTFLKGVWLALAFSHPSARNDEGEVLHQGHSPK